MNTRANSTPAIGRQADRAFTVPTEMLQTLCLSQLNALYDLIIAADELVFSMACQPRFERSRNQAGRNAAGQEAERLSGFFAEYAQSIIDAAHAYQAEDADEFERRAWLLLKHETHAAESLGVITAMAAEMAANHRTLERAQHLPMTGGAR